MTDNNLRLISWNCRSLYNKLSLFKVKLYSTRPHVVCLNETWLKPDREPTFINYRTFFNHRDSSTGGGLLTLVRNDLTVVRKELEEFTGGKLEIQCVTVFGYNRITDILNIYNPNENISYEEFNHYFKQLSSFYIICGDFNAHHELWDDRCPSNASGRNLVNAIVEENCSMLTSKNLPTHYHLQTNSFSTLDLIFVSTNMYYLAEASLEDYLDSDHYPVLVQISIRPQLCGKKRRPKWIFNSTMWAKWLEKLPALRQTNDVDEDNQIIVDAIVKTGRGIFKLTKENVNIKYSKPWWNQECEIVIKTKHRAKNYFHRHPSMENYEIFKEKSKLADKVIKAAKVKSFRDFINEANAEMPVSVLWGKVSALSNKYKPPKLIPLNHNQVLITDPKMKTNIIAENYKIAFNSKCKSNISTSLLLPVASALTDENYYDFNKEISLYEVKNVIANLKPTSPGIDMVHNSFLKNLPESYISYLLNLFNNVFNSSIIPQSWKSALVLPIPKPDKDLTLSDSYRPISLLSCIGKLMEKILCNRLTYFIENNNKLSFTQGGFRKKMSTMDQIARVENVIRTTMLNKQICLIVFIDLSKAYDIVWHTGLLYKLQAAGVKGKLLKWIQNYLKNRKFKTYFEGECSSEHSITSGVPQGSTISPLLFNIMLNDIPRVNGVKSVEYADDLAFYSSHSDLGELRLNIQKQLDEFNKWTKSWGLKVNTSKTKAMIFTSKKGSFSPPIKLGGESINYVTTHRYLGVIFDSPRLTWKHHVQYLYHSSLSRINIIKALSAKQWGADKSSLYKIYIAIVRSRLDYGCVFYDTASHSVLFQLDKLQNVCLRLILGAHKTSPVLSLEVESNIPPLKIHRKRIIMRNYCRLAELPQNVQVKSDLESALTLLNSNWSANKSPPYFIRAFKQFEVNQIKVCTLNPISLMSSIPPWFDLDLVCKTDFSIINVGALSDTIANAIFSDNRQKLYHDYIEIFTDGSKTTSPEIGSAAGMVIYLENTTIMKNYKLPSEVSIMGCELYAIKQALIFIRDNVSTMQNQSFVIFSDSLSGIMSIKNRDPNGQRHLIYDIHELILNLSNFCVIKIQFIPGHKNIEGNELADLAAGAAHSNDSIEECHISKPDKVRTIENAILTLWQRYWDGMVEVTGKGKHLKTIRSKIGFWPWSCHKVRTIETVFSKLRLGHLNINTHLHRFLLTTSLNCRCGQPENINHIFISCPVYAFDRTVLYDELKNLGVTYTIKNLLGGGDFDAPLQRIIIDLCAKFLIDINKLYVL